MHVLGGGGGEGKRCAWVQLHIHEMSLQDLHPLTDERRELKTRAIETAYELRDRRLLADLAASRGGLVCDELRRKVWPLLLGVEHEVQDEGVQGLPPHPEEEQVRLDVARAFVFYPRFEEEEEEDNDGGRRGVLRERLQTLVCAVLRRTPALHYYQGFHDVAQVLLLVCGNHVPRAAALLERLTARHLRDHMLPHVDASVDILRLIPAVLAREDPQGLGRLVHGVEPFYALSSVLTLLAHHVSKYGLICGVFDYLFARDDPATIVYLYAALVVCRRQELTEAANDQDTVHSLLANVVAGDGSVDLDLGDVLACCDELMARHPPQSLGRAWEAVMQFSALRTPRAARFPEVLQSQIAEQEARLKEAPPREHKQPRLSLVVGLSVVVGVLSIYFTHRYLHLRLPS